ncbi:MULTISPECIES: hypothetical protein [unclassified Streptomyces]|nr:hypothetical protein [Streptomyces sp. TSRI0281]
MRPYEETEEEARLRGELVALLDEFTEPQGLSNLGYDVGQRLFVGARVA